MTVFLCLFGGAVVWTALSWVVGTRVGERLAHRRRTDSRPLPRTGERP